MPAPLARLLPRCQALSARLVALAHRYPGILAAAGFASGLVSFFTVKRHEGFARGIAIVMLASWVWLVLEKALRSRVAARFGVSLPIPLLRYATQMIHQEGLFFVLPFAYTATTWNSAQSVFTGLLGFAALVALVDPLYYRWLAPRRWLFLVYHTVTLFAVLQTAFPLVFHLRTGDSYLLALGVAVLLSVPTLAGLVAARAWWRKLAVPALMLALAACGWLARQWVPPSTLWLHEAALATRIDDRAVAPGASLRAATPAELANGLFAYTAVNAPLGLREHIYHVWIHDGKIVDRIALDIQGGRKEGYRAWSYKRNFPADPEGGWQVKVMTDAGQMIGVMRFEVRGEAPAKPGLPQ